MYRKHDLRSHHFETGQQAFFEGWSFDIMVAYRACVSESLHFSVYASGGRHDFIEVEAPEGAQNRWVCRLVAVVKAQHAAKSMDLGLVQWLKPHSQSRRIWEYSPLHPVFEAHFALWAFSEDISVVDLGSVKGLLAAMPDPDPDLQDAIMELLPGRASA